MYKIVKKEVLNSVVVMMEIEAPYVAARCEAGQFVIVRVDVPRRSRIALPSSSVRQ